ncbi:MAG: ferritin-like domain-containing protein [Alphaproteobacteria bacterium]|nr:ferritin-like domain-containing protein [Alphaproteobacteria bacterium]
MNRHLLLPSFLLALGLTGCGDKEEDDTGGKTGGGDSGTTTSLACTGGSDILGPDGKATGYVACPDGSVDRTAAATMDPTHELPSCAGTEESRSCETDADCTDGANGTCSSGSYYDYEFYGTVTTCGCVYSCSSDADCGSGQVCLANGAGGSATTHNTCVTASCTTGADCATDACGVSTYFDGCGWDVQLACRTEADECRADSDCDEDCGLASWSDVDEWTCLTQDCAIGRPLMVDEDARTADGAARSDWASAQAGPVSSQAGPGPAQAAFLAAHWSRVAAMEHGSVASFARFTLQLMALGAPPELLAEAHAAGIDEIRHAQLAYGLATRFGGVPVGPGPLSLDGVDVRTDRADVVRALVEEACVGETLGVAEAHAALQACRDEGVAAVLAEIVADEQRHATLAWKTLRWLLAEDPALAAVAREAADRALARLTRGGDPAPGLPEWGVPSGADRTAARRQAGATLIRPLLDAVLGAEPTVATEVFA